MLSGIVCDRFATHRPATVMPRDVLERALAADDIDRLFAITAQRQYTRGLLFSTAVDLMAAVACRIYPALNAAYQAEKGRVGVSVKDW